MNPIKWIFWFISFATFFYLGASSETKLGAVVCIVAMLVCFVGIAHREIMRDYGDLRFIWERKDKRLYELIEKIGTKDK